MNEPALELHRIGKLYGRTAALKNVSLRLEAGSILALLGPNGSGKTTLLKIIAGATPPTLGRGAIFGRDLVSERLSLRREVGLLASETYLYDDLTALENLKFILTMAGNRPEQAELMRALAEVSLERQAGARVRTFSSGMRRRLSLARLLLLRPRLWLLDEPYNSLDESGADLVDETVRCVAREGGAAVIATHDARRVLALADRSAELARGALIHLGPVTEGRRRHVDHVG